MSRLISTDWSRGAKAGAYAPSRRFAKDTRRNSNRPSASLRASSVELLGQMSRSWPNISSASGTGRPVSSSTRPRSVVMAKSLNSAVSALSASNATWPFGESKFGCDTSTKTYAVSLGTEAQRQRPSAPDCTGKSSTATRGPARRCGRLMIILASATGWPASAKGRPPVGWPFGNKKIELGRDGGGIPPHGHGGEALFARRDVHGAGGSSRNGHVNPAVGIGQYRRPFALTHAPLDT